MNTAVLQKTTTANELFALLDAAYRHDWPSGDGPSAICMFADSLYAEYGAHSAVGRILDYHLNTDMIGALGDALWDNHRRDFRDLWDFNDPADPPSEAAAAMLANPHHRTGRRLSPMSPATRKAAQDYALERLELLRRTCAVSPSRVVRRELQQWERLCKHLGW